MSRNTGWFRFYDRMIDSPQVLELSDSEFRLLVSIWCLASEQEERGTVPFTARALQRRALPDRGVSDIEEMLAHLIELDLLQLAEHGYVVPRWEMHQYDYGSWTPEARREQKRKERQAQREQSQECRNDVASSRKTDTDAEGETETETDLSDGKDIPVAAAVARTHATSAPEPTGDHSSGDGGASTAPTPIAATFIRQVAEAAHLQTYDAAALGNCLACYHARDPARIRAEAGKAFEYYGGKGRPVTVRLLDNWLRREFDRVDREERNGSAGSAPAAQLGGAPPFPAGHANGQASSTNTNRRDVGRGRAQARSRPEPGSHEDWAQYRAQRAQAGGSPSYRVQVPDVS